MPTPEPTPDSTDGRAYRPFMVYLRPATHAQLTTLIADARAAHGSSSARAVLAPLIRAAFLARPFALTPAAPDDAAPPGELQPTSMRLSTETRAELAALNDDLRAARGGGPNSKGSYTQVITELVRRAHAQREAAKARANRQRKPKA